MDNTIFQAKTQLDEVIVRFGARPFNFFKTISEMAGLAPVNIYINLLFNKKKQQQQQKKQLVSVLMQEKLPSKHLHLLVV